MSKCHPKDHQHVDNTIGRQVCDQSPHWHNLETNEQGPTLRMLKIHLQKPQKNPRLEHQNGNSLSPPPSPGALYAHSINFALLPTTFHLVYLFIL